MRFALAVTVAVDYKWRSGATRKLRNSRCGLDFIVELSFLSGDERNERKRGDEDKKKELRQMRGIKGSRNRGTIGRDRSVLVAHLEISLASMNRTNHRAFAPARARDGSSRPNTRILYRARDESTLRMCVRVCVARLSYTFNSIVVTRSEIKRSAFPH